MKDLYTRAPPLTLIHLISLEAGPLPTAFPRPASKDFRPTELKMTAMVGDLDKFYWLN